MFSFTGKQEKMNIINKINNIFTIYVSFQSMDVWGINTNPKRAKNHNEDAFDLQSFSSSFTTHHVVLYLPKGPHRQIKLKTTA